MDNRVRDMRTAKGWSQGDLADALGVSRQSINAIETGRFDPSLPLAAPYAGPDEILAGLRRRP